MENEMYKEMYHGPNEFNVSELDRYLEHIKGYFRGKRIVPLSRAKSIKGVQVYFAFTDDLLESFLIEPEKFKKAYKAAVKYGFLGYSRGGRNGIFFFRKTDTRLSHELDKLLIEHKFELSEYSNFNHMTNDPEKLRKVKIVYHDASGMRIVGVMDETTRFILFLGFAKY